MDHAIIIPFFFPAVSTELMGAETLAAELLQNRTGPIDNARSKSRQRHIKYNRARNPRSCPFKLRYYSACGSG